MPSPTLAIVPLRAPGEGKSRLAPALDPGQRASLSVAMFEDVVRALLGSGIDQIVVAADGAVAASLASGAGLRVVRDAPGHRDLDDVLARAAGSLGVGRDVLIAAADLPLLTSEDVDALLAVDAEVVLAPTNAGGTGGLLRRPANRMPTRYGPASARHHRESALASGADVVTLDLAGFRHDVDTWTDLVALHELEVGRSTARVLPGLLEREARTG